MGAALDIKPFMGACVRPVSYQIYVGGRENLKRDISRVANLHIRHHHMACASVDHHTVVGRTGFGAVYVSGGEVSSAVEIHAEFVAP